MNQEKDIDRMIQIERIILLVEKIWKESPGLRLCQLLGNCFPPGDNYHKRDIELEEALRKIYNKGR